MPEKYISNLCQMLAIHLCFLLVVAEPVLINLYIPVTIPEDTSQDTFSDFISPPPACFFSI